MPIGALAIVEGGKDPEGPLFVDRVTVVGDADYLAGGSTGILAALRAAKGKPNLNILSAQPEGDNGDFRLEYVHATDKLFVRVLNTGVEAADHSDFHLTTWGLTIVSQ
jgi:hypothetical protein